MVAIGCRLFLPQDTLRNALALSEVEREPGDNAISDALALPRSHGHPR
jgi:hypothetical protein